MDKGKRLSSNNGEDLLPEALIQHTQSFLTSREAAQTALLSRSWYQAWLTRPTLDFDQCDFQNCNDQSPSVEFEDFASKSMQRYLDLNLKIDNFRLHTISSERDDNLLANRLIGMAMKLGATHLNLELWSSKFVLPRQVMGSETLVRLHVSGRNIHGSVKWRSLKFLVLDNVHLRNGDVLRDIVSSCKLLEELSIVNCTGSSICNHGRGTYMIDVSGMMSNGHHRLQRLLLENVYMNPLCFSGFASRFPCLIDLSVAQLFFVGEFSIQIVSSSLQRVSFADLRLDAMTAELDVPNLTHFRYSGGFIPSLRIESSRECKPDITITFSYTKITRSWPLQLQNLLTRLMAYKISLSIDIPHWLTSDTLVKGEIEVDSKPLVLENMTIDPIDQPIAFKIMTSLFRVCRPNFLTVYWRPGPSRWKKDGFIVNNLCKKLMKKMISPNCGIPDQSVFGQVGLKEVRVQVYEEILAEWKPLLNVPVRALKTPETERKLCFQLMWG